jgi:hypothetical protein
LVDFGLSVEKETPHSRTYSVSGTSEYLAPEMIANSGHDESVDWWQLGIILCEMFTGKHPFYHRNLYRMQQNIIHRIPQFEQMEHRVSSEARSFLSGLLEKKPNYRLGRIRPGDVRSNGSISAGDIESHPFFTKHGIVWADVERKLYTPPWLPHLSDVADVSNFDSAYTSEVLMDTPNSSYNEYSAPMPMNPSSIETSMHQHNSTMHEIKMNDSRLKLNNNVLNPATMSNRDTTGADLLKEWERERGFHGYKNELGTLPVPDINTSDNAFDGLYFDNQTISSEDSSVVDGYANYLNSFSTI